MAYEFQDPIEYNALMPEIERHEIPQANAIGALLYDLFRPASVIDVGCGPGIYLLPFRERGCEIYGIDAAPAGGQHIPDAYELVDLRNPWTPAKEYDLALCLEVGEHLMPDHAETLVGTVSRCAPLVFWTAAHPGQGGWGHYNEQKPEYWIALFSKFGIIHDPGHTAAVRRVVDVDPVYDHCRWLKQNCMILRRA